MRISRFEERGSLGIVSDTLGNKVDSGVCVSVGDAIDVFEENILRGHGTQVRDESLVATVCGVVDRVNKLICVRALHRRYSAEVGDVVVGRVSEISGKRWKIDLQAKQESHLMLSAVSLPGAVQRRRTAEDELQMRSIFKERDLVSAEVQAVHQDGIVLLHTRSAKYGLLKNGQLVQVSACLIKRQRQHMIVLEDLGVQMILGCNGLIWVGAPMSDDSHGDLEPIGIEQGLIKSIARVVQSIKVLSHLRRMISTLSVTKVVSLSIEMQISPPSMLGTHFLEMVATLDFEGMN